MKKTYKPDSARPMRRLSDVLLKYHDDILDSWTTALTTKSPVSVSRGVPSAKLRDEAESLLEALHEVIQSRCFEDIGSPIYEPVIQHLKAMSASQAKHGVTPSETALLVLSLKESVLPFLQEGFSENKKLLAGAVIRVNRLIDKLGLITFESYVETREKIIFHQDASIRKMVHDPLTGLPNRAALLDDYESLYTLHNTQASVFVVNINHFDVLSSSFGHDAADAIALGLAQSLDAYGGANTRTYRIHMGAFALLRPAGNETDFAHYLLDLARKPIEFNTIPISTDPSVGYWTGDPSKTDPAAALRHASTSALTAFNTGRYVICSRTLQAHDRAAMFHLLRDLRYSLGSTDLFLLYQPKIELGSKRLAGCEALLRWHRPGEGVVSPDKFIPLAEKTGFMWSLTQMIFKEAAKQAIIWRNAGRRIPIAVNVSARDFAIPDMADQLIKLLNDFDILPGMLEIEVTESVMLDDKDIVIRRNLHRFQEEGVPLAIDDYGTGTASLAYLKAIPACTLKIDKSFIQSMEDDPVDYVLTKSTIDMCTEVGIKVVAEGVETDSCAELLKTMGCSLAQGYFFGRPMSAKELELKFTICDCNGISD